MDELPSDWRSHWKTYPKSQTAVHDSGVIARNSLVALNAAGLSRENLTLENTATLDLAKWNLKTLTDQAVKLWIEGEF